MSELGAAMLSPRIYPQSSTPITMKTLQVGDEWLGERPGGMQRYYAELMHHLPATGTDYVGIVVGAKSAAGMTGGKVVACAPPNAWLPRRLIQCRLAGQRCDFDLIAVHFALYGLAWLDQLRSRPSVFHFHGPWGQESTIDGAARLSARAKQMIESQVYRRAKLSIVLSHSFQQELVERFRIDPDRIRIVPGGVDIERFNVKLTRAQARARLGWPNDRKIVISVRRQVRRMGLENVIEAARTIILRSPEVLIVLAGTGPLAVGLQEQISYHQLDEHVRLLGRVDDDLLPIAYRAADMSLVSSQALEGFGLVTLESLACGTPVLVTPVGGLPETITPFAPDCVFADGSASEMSHVIQEFLSGARQLPSEGSCRKYAVEGFAWPLIAKKVRAVYDEALS